MVNLNSYIDVDFEKLAVTLNPDVIRYLVAGLCLIAISPINRVDGYVKLIDT